MQLKWLKQCRWSSAGHDSIGLTKQEFCAASTVDGCE